MCSASVEGGRTSRRDDMGSIRRAPRDNRRWEARYRDPLGAQRTKTFDNKADARVFLAGVESSIARGTWHVA